MTNSRLYKMCVSEDAEFHDYERVMALRPNLSVPVLDYAVWSEMDEGDLVSHLEQAGFGFGGVTNR